MVWRGYMVDIAYKGKIVLIKGVLGKRNDEQKEKGGRRKKTSGKR